jgi:hypothetical protein
MTDLVCFARMRGVLTKAGENGRRGIGGRGSRSVWIPRRGFAPFGTDWEGANYPEKLWAPPGRGIEKQESGARKSLERWHKSQRYMLEIGTFHDQRRT